MGMAEARLGPPMRLPGVCAVYMAGFGPAAWRHCLDGFLAGWSIRKINSGGVLTLFML